MADNLVPPLLFHDIDESFKTEEFEEQGYFDNLDEDPEERTKIVETIIQKMDVFLDEIGELNANLLNELQLDEQFLKRVRQIYIDNWQAFAIVSSICKMSKLTPIECVLRPDHPTVMCRARPTYGNEQSEFMRTKLDAMLLRGIVRECKNPIYGSAAFPVKKKRPIPWRLVIDMKPLNKITIKSVLILTLLEQQFNMLGDSCLFASFDLMSGFDYLPTHENSQQYFVLKTVHGAFYMLGSPMGWISTQVLFHNRVYMEIIVAARLDSDVRQWLDDLLLHAKDTDTFCQKLQQIRIKGVRLNLRKCDLFATAISWCGRRIRYRE